MSRLERIVESRAPDFRTRTPPRIHIHGRAVKGRGSAVKGPVLLSQRDGKVRCSPASRPPWKCTSYQMFPSPRSASEETVAMSGICGSKLASTVPSSDLACQGS